MARAWIVVLAAFVAVCFGALGCRSPGSSTATDLDGHAVDPLASHAKAIVLVFVGTHCPISNRYAPEIARLEARFASRGADFWLVYPAPEDGAEAIREHVRSFALPTHALRDARADLARRAGATVTPEAVVFRAGAVVYRGRIDDRQVDFGTVRPSPTEHDLEDALDAVLAGRDVTRTSAPAIGCSIPTR